MLKTKKIISFVLSLIMCVSMGIPAFAVTDKADNNIREIEAKTLNFIATTFSDFVSIDEYQDELIDEKALAFKQFLNDKREVANLKQNLNGAWSLISSDVRSISTTLVDENIYQIVCEIDYKYKSSSRDYESRITEGYKLLVSYNNGDFKVLAANCNGLSAGSIFSENITTLANDLDLSIFTSENSALNAFDRLYNIGEIKDNLVNSHAKLNQVSYNQLNDNDVMLQAYDENLGRNITWNFFTYSEKSNMTTYQQTWSHDRNPNYADFENDGGDCTNYASQILRSGGSAFNSNPNPGIYGNTYWYYRSSSNRSTSWTSASNLKTFLLRANNTLGPKAREVSCFSNLDVGSIIFLESSGVPYHSVIVAEPGGDPTVSAHTYNYYGSYWERYDGISHTKVEVRGYYD